MRGRETLATMVALAVLLGGCLAGCGRDSGSSGAAPRHPTQARITQTLIVDDRTRDLTIDSPAVGHAVHVLLLLPKDFRTSTRRLPALYLLHGCCDTYQSWLRSTDLTSLSAHTEALIVMPEGGAVGFYSNWRSGPQWETFHLLELPRLLAASYRASSVRSIAGLSMGGLGALDYAARHPGMFTAAASFSGIVDTLLSEQESGGYESLVSSEGADPQGLWGDPTANRATWQAHNPYDLAERLRGTRLYVSCGSGRAGPKDLDPQAASTEAALRAENDTFARRLHRLGIPATVHLYDPGVHDWPYWQRELHRAWPMLTEAMHAQQSS